MKILYEMGESVKQKTKGGGVSFVQEIRGEMPDFPVTGYYYKP